jgi:FAD/FMN-containing dehydrogenase
MSVHQAPAAHRHAPGAPEAPGAVDAKFLTAGHPEFDDARRAWNLAVDQRPAAIATVASAKDVVSAVTMARELGLRIAAQGTGHGAASLGPLKDTILVKTERMRAINVDPEGCFVRVEAGVTWAEAVEAAGAHGLALLAGSSPDVGVIGYTVGGGLSWLGRKHGLACNSVEAIELVTADGRQLRADREHEPELFWALRGGGGSFGVVTAIELRALKIREIYAGVLWWPIELGSEVLHCWRELTERGLPDELTTIGRLLHLPELPELPEPLRGRSFVVIEAYHLGDRTEADELLAPLRALGPENDTIDTVPVQRLTRLSLDPDHPVPVVGDGSMLAELPPNAIDTLERLAGDRVASPLLSVEIRQLGGELGRPKDGCGVLSSIEARYAMFAVGIAPTLQAGRGLRTYLGHVEAEMAPWAAARMYLNFAETHRDPAALWGDHGYRRLCQIKGRFDPDDLIQSNHSIPPGTT